MLLFNICHTLYCHSQEHTNKKTLFRCRGCNSTVSEPIVLQKLHLFLSRIVYWWCGSGRCLNGDNYTASRTIENSISLHMDQHFLEAKAQHGVNKYVYPAWRWTLKMYANAQLLSVYNKIFMQIWWAGHIQCPQHWLSPGIVSVCLALVFGLGQRLCLKKVLNQKSFL